MRPAREVGSLNRRLSSATRGPTFSISIGFRKGSQEGQTENERKTALKTKHQTTGYLPRKHELQAGTNRTHKHPNYRKKEKGGSRWHLAAGQKHRLWGPCLKAVKSEGNRVPARGPEICSSPSHQRRSARKKWRKGKKARLQETASARESNKPGSPTSCCGSEKCLAASPTRALHHHHSVLSFSKVTNALSHCVL